MIMNILVILFVLFIAYLWTQQGLFSAFLHFVCTLAAGAIALAVWEPLVYGALLGMREDLAWSLGLIGPFLASLVILRLASDKLLPGNLKFDDGTNFIGGGAFGFGSGVITVGMLLLTIGFMRLPHNWAGYAPARNDTNGNVVAGDTLWLPADMLTVRLYETLSRGGFTAGRSALALRQPSLHRQAGLVRMSVRDKGRVALQPGAVDLLGVYRVQAPGAVFSDSFFLSPEGEPVRQPVAYLDGSTPAPNAELIGVALAFNAGARESTGQVAIGPGQLRLIVETPEGRVMGVHPIAVISQAQGESLQLGRWRFDAPEVFVASTSTAVETRMAFEFPVPAGSQPLDLLVRNHRIPASRFGPVEGAPQSFASIEARDEAIRTGAVVGLTLSPSGRPAQGGATGARSSAPASSGTITLNGADSNTMFDAGVQFSRRLPSGQLLKSKIRSSVSFNEADTGLTRANLKVSKKDVGATGGPQNLRVDEFAKLDGAAIVKVDVSFTSRVTIAGQALDQAARFNVPILRDTNGQVYAPIGFYTEDGDRMELRFDPGSQLQLGELPTVSRSAPQVKVVLIYAVTEGVRLSEFAFGSAQVAVFDPPALVETR